MEAAKEHWMCSECGRLDGSVEPSKKSQQNRIIKVDTVCHHCGAMLCHHDRKLVKDPAFGIAGEDHNSHREEVYAWHCEDCLERFHPKAQPITR